MATKVAAVELEQDDGERKTKRLQTKLEAARLEAERAARIVRELHVLYLVERRRLKRQFAMTLCNRGHVEIFWTPSGERIIARTVGAPLHGSAATPMPADAVFVGAYTHPFNVNDFLGDLDDAIAKLSAKPTAATCAG